VLLFIVFAVILCVPLADFALTNRQVVTLGLWPADYVIEVPVGLGILAAMAVALILGGITVWISVIGERRRARRAERAVRLLEAQIEELKARVSPSIALPPAA
jgi:uncharacterized integral membrane protein